MAETNLTKVDDYQIYISNTDYSYKLYAGYDSSRANKWIRVPFTKYQIKESDFRVKTASFTTPVNIDLTGGRILVRFVSTKHENFIGIVLDDDYTENKDGTYTYKCQDMSREYMNKFHMISTKKTNHRILKSLLTGFGVGINDKITASMKYNVWSGLRPLYKYAGSYMGNPVSLNMMAQKPKLISKNKSVMEVIRDICHAQAYVDVFFDSKGILQIKPINISDWKQTGLHLDLSEVSERQFKFDITNAITNVIVDSTEAGRYGKSYTSTSLVGLNLPAFFGKTSTETSNPSQSSSGSSTTKAAKSTKTTTKTSASSSGKNGNPFNNKAKRIIVCEDKGGSSGFKSGIIKKLKADGWTVTDLGTGPGTHSKSYDILSSKYAVNLTIYNGVDPKTIDEPVTGWLKGKHEKYGVRLVQMFDSKGWNKKTGTYNKKGIFYKKHGDFRGYRVPKAHDDNFSGARSGVLIEDLHKWYVKYHSRVCYCCGASVSEAYNQFKAGGYLKMKGYVK
jgi:hypothetical protein